MIRSARHLHRYTYADYLAHDEASGVKHEYLDGDIYAMAGGTPDHAGLAAAITSSLFGSVGTRLCRVFSSDLRIKVLATGLATYPDVTVVCGPLETDPESRVTVVNPTLVVEVLSDGTEDYDRGEKLEHYKRIPALREVLLVAQGRLWLQLWRRGPNGTWAETLAGAGQRVSIETLGCDLEVDDIYRRGQGTR